MQSALPNDHMQVLMYKLAMAGLELPVGPPTPVYDPDAEAYFIRAGVTDPVAKQQISDWIEFLKSKLWWNSLVEGFDLRSSHNAGSGLVFYGLKSLLGDLRNGATWVSDGIFKTLSIQGAEVSNFPLIPPVYIFNCARTKIANEINLFNSGSVSGSPAAFFYPFSNNNIYNQVGGVNLNALSGFSDDVFFTASIKTTPTSSQIWANGVSIATGGGGSVSSVGINDFFRTSVNGNATLAASMVFNRDFSTSDEVELRNAYKSTIGQGLGLP